MNPELRALIREAPGAGALDPIDGPFGTGRAEHAVCGDEVEADVRVEGDRIRALAWRARGCPATLAAAAAAGAALVGCPTADVAAVLGQRLASHGGLARHERHAERIVLRAIGDALART